MPLFTSTPLHISSSHLPSPGALALPGSAFSDGSLPLLLSSVNCSGSEANLLQCRYSTNLTGCSKFTNAAGVICQGNHKHSVLFKAFMSKHFQPPQQLQGTAVMVPWDFRVGPVHWMGGWSCVSTMHGAPYVIEALVQMMPQWYADSWGLPTLVSKRVYVCCAQWYMLSCVNRRHCIQNGCIWKWKWTHLPG